MKVEEGEEVMEELGCRQVTQLLRASSGPLFSFLLFHIPK